MSRFGERDGPHLGEEPSGSRGSRLIGRYTHSKEGMRLMAHGHRYMEKMANGYVVRCRICTGRRGRRYFAKARQAHDWWREHEQTLSHLVAASPEGRWAANNPPFSEQEVMLAALFSEKPKPKPPRRRGWQA